MDEVDCLSGEGAVATLAFGETGMFVLGTGDSCSRRSNDTTFAILPRWR